MKTITMKLIQPDGAIPDFMGLRSQMLFFLDMYSYFSYHTGFDVIDGSRAVTAAVLNFNIDLK